MVVVDDNGWQPMISAPHDGTRVDLLFPHPRGRVVDCFWDPVNGWSKIEPAYRALHLHWETRHFNVEPLWWRPPPPLPRRRLGEV